MGVLGGILDWNGIKNDRRNAFSCESPIDIYDELEKCPIDSSISFEEIIPDDKVTGSQLLNIMSQFCRNHAIALTCLSEVAAKCPELDASKRVSEAQYTRFCNGTQPLDWISTALVGYEIDMGCITDGAGSSVPGACWSSAIPANESASTTPVHTRVELFHGYASELLLCLRTGFQLSEFLLTECGTNIEDVLLAFIVAFADLPQVLPFLYPSDDVFNEIKADIIG